MQVTAMLNQPYISLKCSFMQGYNDFLLKPVMKIIPFKQDKNISVTGTTIYKINLFRK